jgi:hypothetical protein
MSESPGVMEARGLVANLIDTGFIPEARAKEADLHPLPISTPDGVPAGWFVALVIGEQLLGFAQFDEALRFRRYSSFAGREPAAKDWLESSVVLSLARERSGADLEFGVPFLSFDMNPDRIAWVVPATGPDGSGRRVFVAGDQVFERYVS